MDSYSDWMVAITTDLPKANRIGGIIGPSSEDYQMFTKGFPCYTAGTTFSMVSVGPVNVWQANGSPVAWVVSQSVRGTIAYYIGQFRDGLYPAPLLMAGMTHQEIDDSRSSIQAVVGSREELEPVWTSVVLQAGYVLSPAVVV